MEYRCSWSQGGGVTAGLHNNQMIMYLGDLHDNTATATSSIRQRQVMAAEAAAFAATAAMTRSISSTEAATAAMTQQSAAILGGQQLTSIKDGQNKNDLQ